MGENVDQRWVGWEGPRLRVLPILLTLFIGLAIIAVSFTLAIIILRHVDAQLIPRLWPLVTIAEAFEFGFALLGIAVARRFLKGATFGIRWPPGRTRVGLAVVWGVLFGIIMLIVDHSGDLMSGITPGARAHTAVDIAGWLLFELLLVGLCDWLRENSGSLLAPIIAHSLSDFVETAAMLVLFGLLPQEPDYAK